MSQLLEIYLGSKELKRLIVKKSDEFRIPLKWICEEVGLKYDSFMKTYINRIDSSKASITEEQFEGILGMLGISVKHTFIINSDFDSEGEKMKLVMKYDRTKIVKNVI